MNDGQKLKLGDTHVTPKKYPRSTSVKAWGCPRHPLLHQQYYRVIFQDTIFLLLDMICVILGASFYFAFSFVLFFLLVIAMIDPIILVWERATLRFFIRTLQFPLLLPFECSVFATTAFISCFSLISCSELVGLLNIYIISSLVLNGLLSIHVQQLQEWLPQKKNKS